jgi:hypothetical protein
MAIDLGDALSRSFRHTKWVLFEPFDLGKWFVLGFAAFLASLGEGGFNFNLPMEEGGPGGEFGRWIEQNLPLFIGIVAAIILVSIVIGLVLLWVRSRARFIFLENVIWNRAAIREPWSRLRRLGNSLFFFELLFGLVILLIIGLLVGLGVAIGVGMVGTGGDMAPAGVAVLVILGIVVLLPVAILIGAAYAVLLDFIVPVMYLRDVNCTTAWLIARHELLPGRLGTLVLYLLLRFALGIAAGMVVLLLMVVTCGLLCCVAMIPLAGSYLLTVLILPIPVFMRALPLWLIDQVGPDWRIFAEPAEPVVPDQASEPIEPDQPIQPEDNDDLTPPNEQYPPDQPRA